jgi:hypothetical protein
MAAQPYCQRARERRTPWLQPRDLLRTSHDHEEASHTRRPRSDHRSRRLRRRRLRYRVRCPATNNPSSNNAGPDDSRAYHDGRGTDHDSRGADHDGGSPTTTTTIDPIETARLAYAGLTSGVNTVIYESYETYGNPPSRKNVQALCAVLAPAVETFANSIRDGDWPESVQDEADALAKVEAAEAGVYYQCANATTTDNALAAWNADSNTGAEASAMRLALGMPIDR